nr:hypothetical protein [Veronia nyctiphanis]
MKKNLIVLIVAISLNLVGCGEDTSLSGTQNESYISESVKADTKVAFDLLSDEISIQVPSFIAMDAIDGSLNVTDETEPTNLESP